MLKFSVGFNGSLGFVDVVAKYRDYIEDIYFVGPGLASGRASGGRLGAQSYTLALHQTLLRAKALKLATNMVFDALCVGSDYGTNRQGEKVVGVLKIHTDLYGLKAATSVSPIDAQLIKRTFPALRVHGSENMFIRNVVQAKEVAPFCDVLVLDRHMNRDIDSIGDIKKATGRSVCLVANEACVLECSNRIQHLNHVSHQQSLRVNYYLPCVRKYQQDKAAVLKSPIIRPEDVGHYEGLADSIKLATRATSDDRIDLILNAYVNRRFAGNLFDITESGGLDVYIGMSRRKEGLDPQMDNTQIPADFWEHVTQCNKLCRECGYCDQIAGKAFRTVAVKRAEAVG